MNFTVTRFEKGMEKSWDEFVESSNNGTIFQLRKFLSYHAERKFIDHSLIFRKNNNIIAVFPAAEVLKNGKKILHSHPGASFGGFVFNHFNYNDASHLIKSFEIYLRKHCFYEIFYIPTPYIYSKQNCDILEYVLLWNHFKIIENYISSYIDLTGNEKDVLKNVSSRKLRYIRKLIKEKPLRFEWCKNYEKFYPILKKNKIKYNINPTHTLDELLKLDSLFPNQFHLLMLYNEDIPIGGTLNIIANSKTAIIFYNMINYDFKSLQPASLQIYETIRWAKSNNFSYLDFGVSQLPQHKNPLTPNPSLIKFKEQFGSRGMIRKAFRKKFST